ncbi:MAG: transketolase [Deinococcota bacterium]
MSDVMDKQALEQRAVNAIRALTLDATSEAGSGHPGMPLGTAAMGYVLWHKFLQHNPKNPSWANRDRFVQSAGHGSMLTYSLLHLAGYDLPMEELKNHRQWGSLTPGHPEHGHTAGVETTTGPLGQGISTAVGMALAEAHLAAVYNKPDYEVVDHYTYVIASDGDIMEGVASEASSLAGHLGLGKLIVLYDDNQVTLDAEADVSFSEDVLMRYQAYGWHTSSVADGNDVTALEQALSSAKSVTDKPSIIAVRTIIGYGAPGQGTSSVHGAALSGDDGAKTRETLGIDWEPFTVPDDALAHWREAEANGAKAEADWNTLYEGYQSAHPELAKQFAAVLADEIPAGLEQHLPAFELGSGVATRNASSKVINALAPHVPQLIGGSADLAGSTKTDINDTTIISRSDYSGRNIYFGVREHGMAAAANGMVLHGGVRPFVGTFFVFSDYLRPSLRLSALMEQPVIYVFTHDSIGLGGDGPTHQPVGQLMALRAIPNLTLIRPADAHETAQAWAFALQHKDGPTALVLSRQNLPTLEVAAGSVSKGAYIVAQSSTPTPELILIATGSEVSLALAAKAKLDSEGMSTRVVSMPSMELFDAQDASYKASILPKDVRKRVAIEAGASLGWYKYVGDGGAVIGLDRFGASADGDVIMEKLGFSIDNVVATAKGLTSS